MTEPSTVRRAPPAPPSDRSPLPVSFITALAIISAFAAMIIWDQSTWWGSKDEYMFGYLVPLFVAYIVFDRWGAIRAALGANRSDGSRGAARSDNETVDRSDGDSVRRSDGSTETLSNSPTETPSDSLLAGLARVLAGLGLLAGLAMFSLGAFYRAGTGASQPGSLAMAMGFAAITLTILYLALPAGGGRSSEAATVRQSDGLTGVQSNGPTVVRSDSPTVVQSDSLTETPSDGTTEAPSNRPTESRSDTAASPPPSDRAAQRAGSFAALLAEPRWQVTCLFAFPALVWLVSAPLVSAVENSLSTFLLNKVTVIVFFTFDALGFPLERQGSVLVLPLGQVGVAEACSGIRSLTGSIFSGCFLAAAFLRGLPRKVGLVLAAVVLAFGMNIVRSLVLTGVAYAQGPEAIEGTIHDVTGFAVLGGTFLGLLALLPLFGRAERGAAAR